MCLCVCVRVQCTCVRGVGVICMYCVSVHVFVHGASKQSRKRANENKSTGKKMIGVPTNGFEPTPTSVCESTVLSPVLIDPNRRTW